MVKGPIQKLLPLNCPVVMLEYTQKLQDLNEFVGEVTGGERMPVCFVIGGFAKGDLSIDYATKSISISQYPLSAGAVASRVC